MLCMATIKPNDNAPSEKVTYLLGNATLQLGPKDSEETEDREAIAGAETHPWLDVDYGKAATVDPDPYAPKTAREDDVLAAENTQAFGTPPEAETAPAEPTAVNANLDQTEVVETANVNETLAADAEDNDTAPKSRKKGS